MRYIDSPGNDAYFNMALEEYVFESLPQSDEYFMLWQNKSAIVVGKYQNTVGEINSDFVRENDIQVVRRLSGGGAMYQDLGNLNFTFVVNRQAAKNLDFAVFIRPVVHALAQMGVTAEFNSRNDIVIAGKKFSGNSQYNKKGRTMHHGTLLFNSNLTQIGQALHVQAGKIESKGIKSVSSRVTNICEHLPTPVTLAEFKQVLLAYMFNSTTGLTPYMLTPTNIAEVTTLQHDKYATWEWNYGHSPAYNQQKHRRFSFGGVDVWMQVEKGMIRSLRFTGDFFTNNSPALLADMLVGLPLREAEIRLALADTSVGAYIGGMNAHSLIQLLLY